MRTIVFILAVLLIGKAWSQPASIDVIGVWDYDSTFVKACTTVSVQGIQVSSACGTETGSVNDWLQVQYDIRDNGTVQVAQTFSQGGNDTTFHFACTYTISNETVYVATDEQPPEIIPLVYDNVYLNEEIIEDGDCHYSAVGDTEYCTQTVSRARYKRSGSGIRTIKAIHLRTPIFIKYVPQDRSVFINLPQDAPQDRLHIYSAAGKIVKRFARVNNVNMWDAAGCKRGVYLIKYDNGTSVIIEKVPVH